MVNLGELQLKITADTSTAESSVNSLGSSLSSGLSSVAKTATVAVGAAVTAATGAVTALAKSAYDAYSEYEQLVGGVETLFGDSSDTILQYANKAWSTAQISANDYLETATSFSASLIQSLGGDTAAAAEYANLAITDMSDNASKMGTDMESIQNAYQGFAKQNYTMLDNLKLGYGGTKSEMERLLEDANEINAQQGIMTDYTIDNFADIVEAIHVIQENMGIAGTTAEEAMFTLEGTANSTKAAWENVVTAIGSGEGIDEAIDDLLTAIFGDGREGSGLLANVIPRIQIIMEGIGQFIETAVPELLAVLPDLLEAIVPSLLSTAINLVETIVETAWNGLQNLLSGSFNSNLLSTLGEIGSNALTKVNETIQKILEVVNNIDWSAAIGKVGEFLTSIGSKFVEALPDLVGKATEIFNSLRDTITSLLDGLIQAAATAIPEGVTTIANGLSELVENITPHIQSAISNTIENVQTLSHDAIQSAISIITDGEMWESVFDFLGTLVSNIFDTLAQTIKDVDWSTLLHDAIQMMFAALRALVVNIIPNIIELGGNIIQGLFEGILAGITQIPEILQGIFTGIVDGIKTLFGINSPSTVMAEIGGYIMQGLLDGITNLIGNLGELVSNIVSTVVDGFTNLKDNVVETVTNVKDNVVKHFTNMKDSVVETASGLLESASEKFESLKENLTTAATNIKDTVVDKFSTLKDNVTDKVSDMKDKVVDKVSDMKDKFQDKVSDLKDNVSDKFSDLKDSVSDTVSDMKDAVSDKVSDMKDKVQDKISDMKDDVKDKFSDMKDDIKDKMSDIKDNISDKWDEAVDTIKSTNLYDTAKDIIGNFKDGLTSAWESVTSWANNAVSSLQNTVSNAVSWVSNRVSGSHRVGLSYVPYDGYVAELHKGEQVLNAEQANQYQKMQQDLANLQQGNSTVINFNGSYQFANQNDIDYFMTEAGKLIKRKVG